MSMAPVPRLVPPVATETPAGPSVDDVAPNGEDGTG